LFLAKLTIRQFLLASKFGKEVDFKEQSVKTIAKTSFGNVVIEEVLNGG